MRAVVDTNILVSGLMHPGSPPGAVLDAIERRDITPVLCEAILAEHVAVLPRPRLRLPAADVAVMLASMERLAAWVDVPPYNGQPALPDVADWPVVACALATGCAVITGNLRHFPPTLGLRVMTAREWVAGTDPG